MPRGRDARGGSRPHAFPTTVSAKRSATRSTREQIETRPIWPPMRIQAPYADLPVLGGDVALGIGDTVLCLPCSAHLTTDQQSEVIDIIRTVVERG